MFNEVESDFGALVRDVFVLRYGFANIDQYLLSHIPWLRLRSYRQSSAETSRAQKNKGTLEDVDISHSFVLQHVGVLPMNQSKVNLLSDRQSLDRSRYKQI